MATNLNSPTSGSIAKLSLPTQCIISVSEYYFVGRAHQATTVRISTFWLNFELLHRLCVLK